MNNIYKLIAAHYLVKRAQYSNDQIQKLAATYPKGMQDILNLHENSVAYDNFKPKLPSPAKLSMPASAPRPDITDPERAKTHKDDRAPFISTEAYMAQDPDYMPFKYNNVSTTDPVSDFAPSPTRNSLNSVSLTAKDPSQFFKSYMGSKFDPKSRVDRNKLKFLQSLQTEGMNLEDVKGNQAAIYKIMKGMKF